MLRRTDRTAKWLIWMVMLMSPLQLLQGTGVLCAVCCRCDRSECQEASLNLTRTNPCCQHNCRNGRLEKINVCWQAGGLRRSSTPKPCKCPPDCWCRQPPLPQHDSARQSEQDKPVKRAHNAVVSDAPASNADLRPTGRLRQRAPTRTNALDVCARLCRFLV